jgi:hypothetical protein
MPQSGELDLIGPNGEESESLPVMENWTHAAQMAHFSANRCHTLFPQPLP